MGGREAIIIKECVVENGWLFFPLRRLMASSAFLKTSFQGDLKEIKTYYRV